MEYTFRKCNETDIKFIYKLKEKCFKWFVEKIYGWNEQLQIKLTQKEMNEHMADMNIIQHENTDIGVFTFYYDDNGDACVGMFAILPDYQGKGIGTQILTNVLEENKNVRIYLKTYRENPARNLYQRVGFMKYDETETHWLMERQALISQAVD